MSQSSFSRAAAPQPDHPPGNTGDGLDLGLLGRATGFLLKRAQIAVFHDFMKAFVDHDIRPAQFSVLEVIARNPGLSQSQVAQALSIKRTNFVPLLDTLEERGLVTRNPGTTDRRSHALALTPGGEALLATLDALWQQHETRLLDRLGPADWEHLHRLLWVLVGLGDGTEAEDADAAPATPRRGRGRRASAG